MAHILVIDDDSDVRVVVQDMLEAAGHEVTFAANGRDGFEANRRRPADLVVTDIFMPNQEGFETIRDLKREFPAVKIIVMSGGSRSIGTAPYFLAATALGADAVLTKPFGATTLLGEIDRLLQQPGAG